MPVARSAAEAWLTLRLTRICENLAMDEARDAAQDVRREGRVSEGVSNARP
jgi:hypothetical protein